MEQNEKIVISMVGLPARGKSYIGRKLTRYLNWAGLKAKVFNIGTYRRVKIGVDYNSSFFDQNNVEAVKAREACATEAIKDLADFLNDTGDVAILDGTNTKSARRRIIEEQLKKQIKSNFKLIWIESICTIEDVIERNIVKTKVTSPDYINWEDREKAADDFRKRIKEYEKIYEPISKVLDGESASFIQIINQGAQIVKRNVRGYIQSKILSYLINLHTGDRPIYFTRHGESEYNKKGLIGGDSVLSESGQQYATYLAQFFKEECKSWTDFKEGPLVYCSTMKRAILTAEKLSFIYSPVIMKSLDEISSGLRDGFSYEEIKEKFPEESEERNKDKLNYRYPRGESYMDVIQRIEPMIYELERRRGPVIIVGHQGMIRCLYGYFACVPIEAIPTLDIPIHTVIKFNPEAYGFSEERFVIDTCTGDISRIDSTLISKYPDRLQHIPK